MSVSIFFGATGATSPCDPPFPEHLLIGLLVNPWKLLRDSFFRVNYAHPWVSLQTRLSFWASSVCFCSATRLLEGIEHSRAGGTHGFAQSGVCCDGTYLLSSPCLSHSYQIYISEWLSLISVIWAFNCVLSFLSKWRSLRNQCYISWKWVSILPLALWL